MNWKCSRCGGQIESEWGGVHEWWDGEYELATCMDCGLEQENRFRVAAGLEPRTKESVLEFARSVGY